MNSKISRFLKKYATDVDLINSLFVSAFTISNKLEVTRDSLLFKYTNCDPNKVKEFITIISSTQDLFSFELLIKLFEFVISPANKIITGAVYTPEHIREYIVKTVCVNLKNDNIENIRIADIACGCGGFLLSYMQFVQTKVKHSCRDIIRNNLYGFDIESYSIERSKILLSLYALYKGESLKDEDFNLYVSNSLDRKTWLNDFGTIKFNAIIGNPPYVTSSKITKDTRILLKDWDVCKSGKVDLYIPFFQVSMELLNTNGVLGYITVNNFYRSLNGSSLREYFRKNKYSISLLDFGGEQIFKGCSTYTCLCFIHNNGQGIIKYLQTTQSNLNKITDSHFAINEYENLDDLKGWRLRDKSSLDFINKIENTGTPLCQYIDIRNGIATLKNEIYILNIVNVDDQFYYHAYRDHIYPIEKGICRDIVKPSVFDYTKDFEPQLGKIIFPYSLVNGKNSIIKEDFLKSKYPLAYSYLENCRDILNQRDKGSKVYEKWYAYGRSQAINLKTGYRMIMPYISDSPKFAISNSKDLLFYNGFAFINESIEELTILHKILSSDIFWRYIEIVSKPYSGGFYSMGKRYIKHFGIPCFSDSEKDVLLKMNDQQEINHWLRDYYKLSW